MPVKDIETLGRCYPHHPTPVQTVRQLDNRYRQLDLRMTLNALRNVPRNHSWW
jgi:hypothetical protein